MPQYKAPLRDMRFVLYDVLEIEQHYARIPGATDLSREVIDSMLSEAAKLVETVVAPLSIESTRRAVTGRRPACACPRASRTRTSSTTKRASAA